VNIRRKLLTLRRCLFILVGVISLASCAWFFLAKSSNDVSLVFKGIERVYAEHQFQEVALFSFTNYSRLAVDRYIANVRLRNSGSRIKAGATYVQDDATTNQLIFRAAHSVQLRPGSGEILAIPAVHGSNEWRVELDYSFQSLRYKLASWLGSAKARGFAPEVLRSFPMHSFQSDWLQPLPEEPGFTRQSTGFKLQHTRTRSAFRYLPATNMPPLNSKP
jgi:hypothetical protein